MEEYTTDFLTTKEAALYLGIKAQSLRWLVTEKIIQSRLATPDEIVSLRAQRRITVVPPGGIRLIAKSDLILYFVNRRKPGPQIVNRRDDNRRCSACREWKSITEFGCLKTYWDGLNNKCKACNAAHVRNYKERRRVQGIKNHNEPTDEQKQCSMCGKIKAAANFGISRNNPDGRNYYCRACRKEKGNPPRHAEYNRAYRARHPDRGKARGAIGDAVRYGKMPPASALVCAYF